MPTLDAVPADREAIRATIHDRVSAGIKGVELACEVAACHPRAGDGVLDVLKGMVADGEIVEIEYVTPDNEAEGGSRAKSFFLPAGTRVRIGPGTAA